MSIGSLYITNAPGTTIVGATFPFLIANFDPPGATPDQFMEEQEELQDLGVDGRRWRRINFQFRPFQLVTLVDDTSYASLILAKRAYELAKGNFGNLSISLAGVTYLWRNVKITDCVPNLRAGVLVGQGASSGSMATLGCRWSMVLMDVEGTS